MQVHSNSNGNGDKLKLVFTLNADIFKLKEWPMFDQLFMRSCTRVKNNTTTRNALRLRTNCPLSTV